MMDIRRITFYYMENDKGKRKSVAFEDLEDDKKKLINLFFEDEDVYEPISIVDIPLIKKSQKGKKFDVICPVYWLNMFFLDNLYRWFEEIPINTLYLGINNPLIQIKSEEPRIKIIDQTNHNTLGACLSELMKTVETEWFVYLHADAEPVIGSFNSLKSDMKNYIGIIESERLHWAGLMNKTRRIFSNYENYHSKNRAYSGFQLIRKKAIEPILDKIEDDFIYRNEDLIFQHECKTNKFQYRKNLGLHVHQCLFQRRTFSEADTNIMQVKGLIKYTQPNKITRNSIITSLRWCKNHEALTLQEMLFFCYHYNPNWAEIVAEVLK
jgi:hypothetical protein